MSRLLRISLYLLAALFLVGGTMHFLTPEPYARIIPPYLPFSQLLVFLSGVAEIGLAVLLLPKPTRRWAAWGLIALLIAVFPANIYMAQHIPTGLNIPAWLLWARLPVQLFLIWWAWLYTRKSASSL
ncbi:MauE/DoxX family redox-associated membrane protein [Hymenobacter sp. BT730]|uniref:DoxX family protein n=1 Tax=Hymenobacter sp. BT730 TaxID=3063332 RepID=UPI0026DFD767|nr:MauE/DoxX family redox-associated membrane protein [Hymenobacter sp. BT730]